MLVSFTFFRVLLRRQNDKMLQNRLQQRDLLLLRRERADWNDRNMFVMFGRGRRLQGHQMQLLQRHDILSRDMLELRRKRCDLKRQNLQEMRRDRKRGCEENA